MKKHIVQRENEGIRVDKFVTMLLQQEYGFEEIPRAFVSGVVKDFVLINNSRAKHSYRLKLNDEVSIDLDLLSKKYGQELERSNNENKIVPQEGRFEIIFEDRDYLVLKKAKGLVVHPGIKNEKNTLANYVLDYLQRKGEYDKELKRAGIVHRLDKGVGGIIVFAKNRKVQRHLAEQFENHKVLKIYYAEVEPCLSGIFKHFYSYKLVHEIIEDYRLSKGVKLDNWKVLEGSMKRDEKDRKRYVFLPNTSEENLRYAKSYILPLSYDKLFVLIETGRMHQVRATLKSLGCVLKGDRLYGAKAKDSSNIALDSVVLGFEDLSGEKRIFNILGDFIDE